MIRMSMDEVREVIGATLVRGDLRGSIAGVSTDTRTLVQGNLFVALAGESFDGHDFVEAALSKGASGLLVEHGQVKDDYPGNAPVLSVPETLTALGDLAGAYRSQFAMPFVAITGSNGKTTTKEMIVQVLSGRGKVVSAKKSFNNFVGVPLTLFEVVPDAFAVVVEMGTSAPGEIARLCEIARPNVGVITNIRRAHLEGLKTIQGVASAKAELLGALGADDVAIINADDEWSVRARGMARCRKVVTFGASNEADIFARDIRETAKGVSFTTNEHVRVALPILGRHNVYNALAAIAVCRRLGVGMKDIGERLAGFRGVPMRMERVKVASVTVINDAYNANPDSMAAALAEFKRYRTSGAKHFVCGDMLELGEHSAELHRELGERVAASGIDRLWLLGSEVKHVRAGAVEADFDAEAITMSADYARLEKKLLGELKKGDVVLIKGSRRMRLERVLEALRASETRPAKKKAKKKKKR